MRVCVRATILLSILKICWRREKKKTSHWTQREESFDKLIQTQKIGARTRGRGRGRRKGNSTLNNKQSANSLPLPPREDSSEIDRQTALRPVPREQTREFRPRGFMLQRLLLPRLFLLSGQGKVHVTPRPHSSSSFLRTTTVNREPRHRR